MVKRVQVLSGEGPEAPDKIVSAAGSATGRQTGVPGGGEALAKTKATAAVSSAAVAGGGSEAASGSESAGTATAKGDISLGAMIEAAMTGAIKQVQIDSEAVAANPGLSDEEKQDQLAALNDPANVHDRMMQARDKAKADWDIAYAAAGKPITYGSQ